MKILRFNFLSILFLLSINSIYGNEIRIGKQQGGQSATIDFSSIATREYVAGATSAITGVGGNDARYTLAEGTIASRLDILETATFTYTVLFSTVGSYNWTVPYGVNFITVEMKGGSGGDFEGDGGAYGQYIKSSFTVTSGNILNLNVGGVGNDAGTVGIGNNGKGGFNGGGDGGLDLNFNFLGNGGGGATDIRIGGSTWTDRVLVAGGGAGDGLPTGENVKGGNASYPNGLKGMDVENTQGGGGGTQSEGGYGGWDSVYNYYGSTGILGVGGNGADGDVNSFGGAGGGGGYYGGGGGGAGGLGLGGGGGSSYSDPTYSTIFQTATTKGDGYLKIIYKQTMQDYVSSATSSITGLPSPDARFTLFKDTAEGSIEGWRIFQTTFTASAGGGGFDLFASSFASNGSGNAYISSMTALGTITSTSGFVGLGAGLTGNASGLSAGYASTAGNANTVSNGLYTNTNFSGDVSGAYNATAVQDDSHNHTGATISGLPSTAVPSWDLFKSTAESEINQFNLCASTIEGKIDRFSLHVSSFDNRNSTITVYSITATTALIQNLSVEQSANIHNTVTFSSNIVIDSTGVWSNITLPSVGAAIDLGYIQMNSTGNVYGLWIVPRSAILNVSNTRVIGCSVGINYKNIGSALTERVPFWAHADNAGPNTRQGIFAFTGGTGVNPQISIGKGGSGNLPVSDSFTMGYHSSDSPFYPHTAFIHAVGQSPRYPPIMFFKDQNSGTGSNSSPHTQPFMVIGNQTDTFVTIGSSVSTSTWLPSYFPETLVLGNGLSANNYFKVSDSNVFFSTVVAGNPLAYIVLRPTGTQGTNTPAFLSSGAPTSWQAMNNSIPNACMSTIPVAAVADYFIYYNFRIESASMTYPIKGVSISCLYMSTSATGATRKMCISYSSSTTAPIYFSTVATFLQTSNWAVGYSSFTGYFNRNPITGKSWTWEQINTGVWGGAFGVNTSVNVAQVKDYKVEVYYSSTSQIIYDNNRMGIGEGNPQATLDVRGLGNPNSQNPYLLVLATSADIMSARETINSVGEYKIVATSISYSMNGSTYAQTHVAREMAISSYSITAIATMTLTIPDAVFHGRSIHLIIISSGSSIACAPILRFNGETGTTLTYSWRGSSDTVLVSSANATGVSLFGAPSVTSLRPFDSEMIIHNNVSTNAKLFQWEAVSDANSPPTKIDCGGKWNNNSQITSFRLSNPQGATFNGLTMFVEVINP